jgi:hypothetical protein
LPEKVAATHDMAAGVCRDKDNSPFHRKLGIKKGDAIRAGKEWLREHDTRYPKSAWRIHRTDPYFTQHSEE